MKKLFLTLMAMVLSAPLFAQFHSGGFSLSEENLYYGIRIGFMSSHITGDNYMKRGDSRVGVNLGGIIGVRVSNSTPIFLESGLLYTAKGGEGSGYKTSINYLELPVLVKYGIEVDKFAILPFFGPYFAMAISGKEKDKELGESHSSFRDGAYTHPDMGFKLGCGAEYSNLYMELGYEFGVANISDHDGYDAHTSGFFMNFGVNF